MLRTYRNTSPKKIPGTTLDRKISFRDGLLDLSPLGNEAQNTSPAAKMFQFVPWTGWNDNGLRCG
jgi:hypothetical protein